MVGNSQTKLEGQLGTQRGNKNPLKTMTLTLRALAQRVQQIRSLVSIASQD